MGSRSVILTIVLFSALSFSIPAKANPSNTIQRVKTTGIIHMIQRNRIQVGKLRFRANRRALRRVSLGDCVRALGDIQKDKSIGRLIKIRKARNLEKCYDLSKKISDTIVSIDPAQLVTLNLGSLHHGDFTSFFSSDRQIISRGDLKAGDCVELILFEHQETKYLKELSLMSHCNLEPSVRPAEIIIGKSESESWLKTVNFSKLHYGDFTKFFDTKGNQISPTKLKMGDCLDMSFLDQDMTILGQASLSEKCYHDYSRISEIILEADLSNAITFAFLGDIYYGDFTEFFDLNGNKIHPLDLKKGDCLDTVYFWDKDVRYLKRAALSLECHYSYFRFSDVIDPLFTYLSPTFKTDIGYLHGGTFSTFSDFQGNIMDPSELKGGDCIDVVAFRDERKDALYIKSATLSYNCNDSYSYLEDRVLDSSSSNAMRTFFGYLYHGDYSTFFDLKNEIIPASKIKPTDCLGLVLFRDTSGTNHIKKAKIIDPANCSGYL